MGKADQARCTTRVNNPAEGRGEINPLSGSPSVRAKADTRRGIGCSDKGTDLKGRSDGTLPRAKGLV
ncbi:hypothetical protein Q3G72_007801 [Acer saccharum]|nr:hypothetical protein Q3G72_007801 [Acer saccharum]